MIKKWWRERSTQERWMVALIAVLLIGIAVRWAWVSDEVAGAWRERFSAPEPVSAPAPVEAETPAADSTTQNDSLP